MIQAKVNKIFVNLPVQNLQKSISFFKALGFTFNPQFTNDDAACMIITDDIYTMLLTHQRFADFTSKDIVDAKKMTEVLTCLSVSNRDEVNKLVDAALKAGATETREPQDHGFMFGRSFNDLDGHIWEIIAMEGMPG